MNYKTECNNLGELYNKVEYMGEYSVPYFRRDIIHILHKQFDFDEHICNLIWDFASEYIWEGFKNILDKSIKSALLIKQCIDHKITK